MGMYAPLILGEIEGLKIGIGTDESLWEISKTINYQKFEGEWLIGYGVGFNIGQNYRFKLKWQASDIQINERVASVLWLLEHKGYSHFKPYLDHCLVNLHEWQSKTLSEDIIAEAQSYLKELKLQRALNVIEKYYEREHRLITLKEYSNLPQKLHHLRKEKQQKSMQTEEYLLEKSKIEAELVEWMKNNRTS